METGPFLDPAEELAGLATSRESDAAEVALPTVRVNGTDDPVTNLQVHNAASGHDDLPDHLVAHDRAAIQPVSLPS